MNFIKGIFGGPGSLTNDDIKKLTTETDMKKGDIKKIHKKYYYYKYIFLIYYFYFYNYYIFLIKNYIYFK